MKIQQLKTYWVHQSSSKRGVYSKTFLLQETRKTSNRQPNFTPETAGKRRTIKTKIIEGKTSKDLSRNSEKEMKETIVKIKKKKKAGSLRR